MKNKVFTLACVFIFALSQTLSGNEWKNDPSLSGKLKQGVREIQVEAFRYGFKPTPIVVQQGNKVRLLVKSVDSNHGMLISEFRINEVLRKGETKIIEFTADRKGMFEMRCSVYCGPGHAKMSGQLIVR